VKSPRLYARESVEKRAHTRLRRIAGEQIEHPLFDDRFQAIPMYSGNPWFLPIVGAYYRLRDVLG